MQQRLQDLQSTIEAALKDDDFERVLRLVIQNLPKNRTFMPLRRYVAMVAVASGQAKVAEQILGNVARFELDRGNLLGALFEGLTLANITGTAPAVRDDVVEALGARAFREVEETGPVAPKPDLAGDKPPLPLPALVAVAREMAVHPPPAPADDKLDPITLISGLSAALMTRWATALRVGARAAGQPILNDTTPVAWIVEGSIETPKGPWFPPAGTLVGCSDAATSLVTATGLKFLTLDPATWEAFRAEPEVAEALDRLRDDQRLLRALHASRLMPLFGSTSQREVLAATHVFRANEGTVLAQGAIPAGIYLVVDGQLRGVSRDQDIAVDMGRLEAGELFGISSAFGDEAADRSYEVVAPAIIAVMQSEVLRQAVRRDPDARLYLETLSESSVLNTGEVLLLDEESGS